MRDGQSVGGDLLIVRFDDFRAQGRRTPDVRSQKSARPGGPASQLKLRLVSDEPQDPSAGRRQHFNSFAAHNKIKLTSSYFSAV
jgi:hypothetical protein